MADASGASTALRRAKEASALSWACSVESRKPASFDPSWIDAAIRGPSPLLASASSEMTLDRLTVLTWFNSGVAASKRSPISADM